MDEKETTTNNGYGTLSWPCLTFFLSTNCRTKAEAVLRRLSIGGSKSSLSSYTIDRELNAEQIWDPEYTNMKERSCSFDSDVAGSGQTSIYGGSMKPIHVVTSEPTLQKCMAEIHNAIPSCHSDPEQDSDMYYDFGILTPEDGFPSGSSVVSRITVEPVEYNQENKNIDKPESGRGTSVTSPTQGTFEDGLFSNPPSPVELDSQHSPEVKLEEVRNLLRQTKMMGFTQVPWIRTFRCPNHHVHYATGARCFRKRFGSKSSVEFQEEPHDNAMQDDCNLTKKSRRKRKKLKKGHNNELMEQSQDSSPVEEFGVYYPLQAEHEADSDGYNDDEVVEKIHGKELQESNVENPNQKDSQSTVDYKSQKVGEECLSSCDSHVDTEDDKLPPTEFPLKQFANMSSSDRSPLVSSKRKDKRKPIKTYRDFFTSKIVMKDLTYVDIDINEGDSHLDANNEETESCAVGDSYIPQDMSCESHAESSLYQMPRDSKNDSNSLSQEAKSANSFDRARSALCSLLDTTQDSPNSDLVVRSSGGGHFDSCEDGFSSACTKSQLYSDKSIFQKVQVMPDFEGHSKVESATEGNQQSSSASNNSTEYSRISSENKNGGGNMNYGDRLPRVRRRRQSNKKDTNSLQDLPPIDNDDVNFSSNGVVSEGSESMRSPVSDLPITPESVPDRLSNRASENGDGPQRDHENTKNTNENSGDFSDEDTIECLVTEESTINGSGFDLENQESVRLLEELIENSSSPTENEEPEQSESESQNAELVEQLEQLEVNEAEASGATSDEERDTQTRIKRSSSLKCGKTPPGTPGRKKVVRFVDALGLDLVDVRTYLDDVPNIPKSAYCDLDLTEAETQTHTTHSDVSYLPPKRMISPMFQQPGSLPDFLDRVRSQKVCLENIEIDPSLTIKGMIRVLNLDYHKKVHVRYTYDNWKSFHETLGTYIEGTSDGFSDKFYFFLLGSFLQSNGVLTFCIKYTTKGQEYWDNNRGVNYILQCYPAPPTGNRAQNDSNLHTASHRVSEQSSFTNVPSTPTDPWAVRFF